MDIDFILTYLNPNDIKWQKEKNQYAPGAASDVNPNRYREWDNLQYFFRGVEKFAPWVRKVHIVTCGHLPSWLNTKHPKLNVVHHSDYIPKEWLPTFSSRCIDMNFHRIPELSEHFVYFNDDMFITKPVEPEVFFKNGLPCDAAILRPTQYRLISGIALHLAPVVNTAVINKYFKQKEVVKEKRSNWITFKYGKRNVIYALVLKTYPKFCGFAPTHLPYSYLKSTYETVWDKEGILCENTSKHRFREPCDLNHWIFNYWQFATNQFYPRSIKEGKCYQLHRYDDAENAYQAITHKKYKMVCLNDTLEDNAEFEIIKGRVNSALKIVLPDKSTFEL